MSKATKRLRRAGIGGLTAAVALGTVVAGSGSAFAYSGAALTATRVGSTTNVVYPGASGQALNDVTVGVDGWQVGDQLDFTLTNTNATCATDGYALGFSSAPSLAAAFSGTPATGSTAVLPKFTVALKSSNNACAVAGVKDVVEITFTNSDNSTTATDDTEVDVTKLAAVVGSKLTGTIGFTAHAIEGDGGTAPVDASTASPVGQIALLKASIAQGFGARTGSTATVPAVTLTEVNPGQVGAAHMVVDPTSTATPPAMIADGTYDISFALNVGTWTGKGALAVPSGIKINGSSISADGKTLTYNVDKQTDSTSGAGKYVLSGATAKLPAAHAVVTVTPAASAAPLDAIAAVGYDRIAGADRYATAAKAFNSEFQGEGTAVIATGAGFADALSANYLAARAGTGVLLTAADSLPASTRQALINAADGDSLTVYIVGGTDVVSEKVRQQIEALGDTTSGPIGSNVRVIRVSGADRYQTAREVAEYDDVNTSSTVGETDVDGSGVAPTAIIATGANFPDALAAAPASYGEELPLLLTGADKLNGFAAQALADLNVSNVVIVGGTDVVSSAVETELAKNYNVVRLSGASRQDTAAAIATWELATPVTDKSGGLSWGEGSPNAYLATGVNFPDALAGAAVAGANSSPVFLTPLSTSEDSVLGDYTADVFSSVTVFGGTDVVGNESQQEAANSLL